MPARVGCGGAERWLRLIPDRGAMGAASLLIGATLGMSALPAMAAPTGASPAKVAATLRVNRIPAEIVLLVDISQSMSFSSGLYPALLHDVPRFLGHLAKQDPQDLVAVVTFGARTDTQVISLGSPRGKVPLPPKATSIGTDFGFAFQKALDILTEAPPRIQVGGVLLLSDGILFAPRDRAYGGGLGYRAQGWATLRSRVRGLGIPVTGYGLPLSDNQLQIDNVRQALGDVFSLRETLAPDLNDLNAEFDVAAQQILASRVRRAAQLDSGRGVAVSWSGAPGAAGQPPLDLGPGSAELPVQITARTAHIPLTVSRMSVSTSGFSRAISGSVTPRRIVVTPGRPVTVTVHLRWRGLSDGSSFFGGSRPSSPGRLTLLGSVSSSFTTTLRESFGDRSFSTGGIADSLSPPLPTDIPVNADFSIWGIVLPLLAIIMIAVVAYRTKLTGKLILSWVGEARKQELYLASRPIRSASVHDLTGHHGRITARGSIRSGTMRLTVRFAGEMPHTVYLDPGGRTMVAGIWVVHDPAGARVAGRARPSPYPLRGLGQ